MEIVADNGEKNELIILFLVKRFKRERDRELY
jgi:hypothetical protein